MKSNDWDFDFEGNHGSHRRRKRKQFITQAIIAGVVLCMCLIIVIAGVAIKGRTAQKSEEADIFAEIDNSAGAVESAGNIEEHSDGSELNQDAVQSDLESSNVDNADNSTKENSGNVENSTETSSTKENAANEGIDPGDANGAGTGQQVDVAELVNASSVGENKSITYGIDVSRFQGTIDWAKVAGSGIDFAMIRVGYRDASTGEIKADSNAKFNMQEAEKNGIKIGAYFFSTAISADEAKEEANWVTNYISKYPITYPVGYNCEGFEKSTSRQYGLSVDERSNIAIAFLQQIYSAGYTPIFYASRSELSQNALWNTSQIEKSYKIWMAWYNQSTSDLASGPEYDGQCAMWQYTNQGTVNGISKNVDVDVAYFGYNGIETAKDTSEREIASADVEALMDFDAVDETVTAKNNTNLRDKPSQGSDSTVKTTLQNGQTAQRTGISSSGWSRVVYEGTTYYAVSSFLTTDLSAPKQEDRPAEVEQPSGFKTRFTDCNETVSAKDIVNLRSKPSVTDEDSQVIATLNSEETAIRTGINNEYGWSRVEYNGQTLYCVSSYLRVVE
jgi:GH25 family lysozyme M1 (1,4-beta-N-acetylmuramidase)